MKTSLITTVLNEELTIEVLLDSIISQTKLPDEVIIVDGGSTDSTLPRIHDYQRKFRNLTKLILLKKAGNRAVGRNEAVRNAKNEIILCTDAGCILDKKWIKEINEPFENRNIGVVAGYYKGLYKNIFQKCLIPYVLVMEDKINIDKFLPASRSMAFRKNVWEKIGGFDEELSHNEDYDFAIKLKKFGSTIKFQKSAIAYWIPRSSLKEAFIMFFRFAYGDIEGGILRPKVYLIFIRYILGLTIIVSFQLFKSVIILYFLSFILFVYLFWAVNKNYNYVKDVRAFLYLPMLQLVSDLAVIAGSIWASVFKLCELVYKFNK